MKIPFRIGEDVLCGKKQYRIVDFGYSKDEIHDIDGCWVVDESLTIREKKSIFKLFKELKKLEKDNVV